MIHPNELILDKLKNQFLELHNHIYTKHPLPDALYHYTNFVALEKILEERKLSFTDYKSLNDPTELSYGMQIIQNELLNSCIHLYHPCYNIFQETINKTFENFDDYYSLYICCFSIEIRKLNLWRYYTDNGNGCAIAFNKDFFKIEPLSYPLGKQPIILPIIYETQEISTILQKFVNAYCQTMQKLRINQMNQSEIKHFYIKFDSEFLANLIALLPMLKDSSYMDEKEIRLCYLECKRYKNSSHFDLTPYKTEITINNKLSTKYCFIKKANENKTVINLHTFDKNHISEIWVSPACEFTQAEKFIRKQLNKNNYSSGITIKHSSLPYQNTK